MTSHAFTAPRSVLAVLAGTIALAAAVGILTAYAQGWLPDQTRSLANSVGPWALVAFCAALLARTAALAAATGAVCLGSLMVGYVIGASAQHHPSDARFIAFWGAAALVAGPLLGVSASWMRSSRPVLCGAGGGAVGGVLVGEGLYGLGYISGTTYVPYWAAETIVGLLVLAASALRQPRSWVRASASLGVGVLTAVAFVAIYSADLIGRL